MLLLILFSLIAGFATVLSPCILPVLPALLSASSVSGKWRPLGIVTGLVFSFAFFTLALTTLVQNFGFSANALRSMAILIIGFFGFVMISPYMSELFARMTSSIANLGSKFQFNQPAKSQGFLSGLILGAALGVVWTPCAGPILAAITALVATQQITFNIVLITIAYSIGAGIPLLAIAYGGNKIVRSVPFFSSHSEWIRSGFGWVMLLTALALAFNVDVYLQQKILDYIPKVQIENSAWLEKQLQTIRPPPLSFPSGGSVPKVQEEPGTLPKIAPAPEFAGLSYWLNSMPLSIQGLKGKVILVDFWTYSCINCIRTFPYIKNWWQNYKDKGLVIVGIHTPEFEFEKNLDNVAMAVKRFEIEYPVALDNQYATWTAYHNSYWPAHYLIDQDGFIRQIHFGEGGYLETENAIRSLLHEPPLTAPTERVVREEKPLTPEIYLGYKRAANYPKKFQIQRDKSTLYTYTDPLEVNHVALNGEWSIGTESITSESDHSTLSLNFTAKSVYMVLSGAGSQPITMELDGKKLPTQFYTKDMNDKGEIFVKEPRKYDVINLKDNERHILKMNLPKGTQAFTFTFN